MTGVVTSLFHPVIAVSAMDAAVAFYRDLLGLTVTFADDHDPAAIEGLFGYPDPIVHAVVLLPFLIIFGVVLFQAITNIDDDKLPMAAVKLIAVPVYCCMACCASCCVIMPLFLFRQTKSEFDHKTGANLTRGVN